MLKKAHSESIEDLLSSLNTDAVSGLTSEEAAIRLKKYGPNLLSRKKPKSIWKILLEQFSNPIVFILVGAMILAFLYSENIEGIAILLVIIINTIIGFAMEYQAIKSFDALNKMVQTNSRVIRDSQEITIPSRLLVPGDILLVREGEVIPADSRILKQQSLLVKESMLTGESDEVGKNETILPEKTRITEQSNMLFNGTLVSRGNARAVVSLTGDKTAIGEISEITRSARKKRPPLQKKLTRLTNWLIILTLVLSVLIVLTGLFTENDLELMLKTGIALAVAAIPEGLPVVATITLARGMVKLSRQNVVIKKLDSVQTLGETNTICTDKTGTLTENKMRLKVLQFYNTKMDVSEVKNRTLTEGRAELSEFLKIAVLCNDAEPVEASEKGDAIDNALMDFARKSMADVPEMIRNHEPVWQIPFDVIKKLMATFNKDGENYILNVKGAPESIIKRCRYVLIDAKAEPMLNSEEWNKRVQNLAADGLKVLAFANKSFKTLTDQKEGMQDLVLVAIAGFLDPPRQDVAKAVQVYNEAGISVKMITGDHPGTAENIAKAIGIIPAKQAYGSCIQGIEFTEQNKQDMQFKKKLLNARVFARMLPSQKLELVKFFQENEGVVGMLGDGVNDAPALSEADIGIAMGIRGTEAAKEVADVILLDDKFTAIKLAIQQGRAIFENIRYFVIFLISCNLAEVVSVSIASFTNLPLPLLPMQILFLNLVTDVFPALALGMGKGSENLMKQPPRPPSEELLTKHHWLATISYGLSITLSVIGTVVFAHYYLDADPVQTNNLAFNTLVLAQLVNIFNLPAAENSFFKNEVTTNKWVWIALAVSVFITYLGYRIGFLSEVLSLKDLRIEDVLISLSFAVLSVLVSQLLKRSRIMRF
ncbi:cation-transporting P-type ATPase [Gramella sp. BOM4]|nr:cation-transporting P-type ATPase [Christiangramia bathymodioli]